MEKGFQPVFWVAIGREKTKPQYVTLKEFYSQVEEERERGACRGTGRI